VASSGSATPPQACAAGSYQAGSGASSCTPCAPGTVQSASGQSACIAIPKAVSSVIFDPLDSQRLYSGIDNAGVYFSIDGGANWTAASTQPSHNRVKALVLKPGTTGSTATLFAGSYGGGVFKSADSGNHWSACATSGLGNLNVLALTMDGASPAKLYAGTEAGVFVSADDCASWTALNAGMP
jgi:photosystem II stability/assembly factor-like uncharacterized protein